MNYGVTQFNFEFMLYEKERINRFTKEELEFISLKSKVPCDVNQFIEGDVMVSDSKVYECTLIGTSRCLVIDTDIHLDFKKYRKNYNKFLKTYPHFEYEATELYNANINIFARFYNCSIESLFKDYSRTRGFIKKLETLT